MDRNEKHVLYKDLVAGYDDLAIKGKTSAYAAVNGNMFSFLSPDGTWAFRLSVDDKASFEATFGPAGVIQYERVMRGYVGIGDDVATDMSALKDWFAKSVAFARTLKPKPTEKR